MVLPGHLAGGYLAAHAVLFVMHPALPASDLALLAAIGTLAGEAPDIDLFFFYLAWRPGKKHAVRNHRDYITHAPIAWLTVCMVLGAIGCLLDSAFIETLAAVIFAGTWSHFIFDSIEYGVHWLWPFSNKRFCLRELPDAEPKGRPGTFAYYFDFIRRFYFKNITSYCEIAVTAYAAYVFLR